MNVLLDKSWFRMLLRLSLIAILVVAGFWLRSLPALKATAGLTSWWPWTRSKMVTLYFADGKSLFPVSRRIPTGDDVPRAALQALLAGPSVALQWTPDVLFTKDVAQYLTVRAPAMSREDEENALPAGRGSR